ncbi:hypothetical protein GCM10009839_71030 [Catenulispora yoronensis]|uniref:Secreted protein n=1 Tax=Catenulispora yoronensis TaxID=450799 RepID=A0ABN2VC95_9ACTN
MFTGTVRRLFWVSMGATAGVLVFRKVTATAKELTPSGIADRVSVSGGGLLDSVKEFFEDVRELARGREEELNVALGIDVPPAGEDDGSSKKARAI